MLVLLWIAAVVAVGYWIVREQEQRSPAPRLDGPMTGRELAGLILIDYTPDLVLVSPRDVELPYSDGWSLDDVVETLVEIDAL